MDTRAADAMRPADDIAIEVLAAVEPVITPLATQGGR